MLSMTGYGSASERLGSASITVEARAVNQRFLDLRVRTAPVLAEHAVVLDEVARRQLGRGRIELSARVEGSLVATVALDRERAKSALRELAELSQELGLAQAVPLSLLSVLPGLFVEQAQADADAVRAALRSAAEAACSALSAMRRTEGRALERDLRARTERVLELCREVERHLPELRTAHRDRLRARIASLLEGQNLALVEGRLEQEVALLAERSDVSEELTRLESHAAQFAALLTAGDEPIGRRLEFLLQEMGREVNTLGSKVSDLRITGRVIELKTELERMREQVQNVL